MAADGEWRGVLAAQDVGLKRLRDAHTALALHLEQHAAGLADGCHPAGVGPGCHELRGAIREAVGALRAVGEFVAGGW